MPRTIRYTLRLEGVTPETLPLADVAAYLEVFARLLGREDGVWFGGMEKGCVRLHADVTMRHDSGARHRFYGLKRGIVPADAGSAYDNLTSRLEKDGRRATLHRAYRTGRHSARGEVVPLPLPRRGPTETVRFGQPGTVEGVITHINRSHRDQIRVALEDGTGPAMTCFAPDTLSPRLHVNQYVRFGGMGDWSRTADGRWTLNRFQVSTMDTPDPGTDLKEALDALRTIKGGYWGTAEDPLSDIQDIRGAGE